MISYFCTRYPPSLLWYYAKQTRSHSPTRAEQGPAHTISLREGPRGLQFTDTLSQTRTLMIDYRRLHVHAFRACALEITWMVKIMYSLKSILSILRGEGSTPKIKWVLVRSLREPSNSRTHILLVVTHYYKPKGPPIHHFGPAVDACCDRGRKFCVKYFSKKDGAPQPQIVCMPFLFCTLTFLCLP